MGGLVVTTLPRKGQGPNFNKGLVPPTPIEKFITTKSGSELIPTVSSFM